MRADLDWSEKEQISKENIFKRALLSIWLDFHLFATGYKQTASGCTEFLLITAEWTIDHFSPAPVICRMLNW
jgi:hypothetical protein